jgi:hypothetical protein
MPQTYQCLWDKDWQSNSICAYGGLLACGDGNQNGENELYAVSGNITTGHGIVQCQYTGNNWSVSTVANQQNIYAFTALLAGDADNDQVDEVYAANHDHYLYQFKYANNHWQKSVLLNFGNDETTSLALGDLCHDGKNELYAANQDGHIYQLKWTGSAWLSRAINKTRILCKQIAIGDADNDGQDELYAAGQDGHAYRFKFTAGTWQISDLGNAKTPLNSIAVGDGDNDFQREVYAVADNAHVYQFKARSMPTPMPTPVPALTPAITPIPDSDKKLRVVHNQINSNQNEQVRIRWYQPNNAPVTLEICNFLGNKIATLADNRIFALGQIQEIAWDGKTSNSTMAKSGIYIVYLRAGDYKVWTITRVERK